MSANPTVPPFATIKLQINEHGIAYLTLARPEKHNVLDEQMIEEITEAAKWLELQDNVRGVVLTGAGKSFCAGGDLNWMKRQFENDRAARTSQALALASMLKALNDLSKFTIARVNGSAYGGGLGMMAVCDVVIASENARFTLSETKLGLIPATIGPYVVNKMGEGGARRAMLNAKLLSATEAKQFNLVHEVVASEQLDETVQKEIDALILAAPGAVAHAKQFIFSLCRNETGDDVSAFSATMLANRWESPEAQQGISAFFAGEKPEWAKR